MTVHAIAFLYHTFYFMEILLDLEVICQKIEFRVWLEV